MVKAIDNDTREEEEDNNIDEAVHIILKHKDAMEAELAEKGFNPELGAAFADLVGTSATLIALKKMPVCERVPSSIRLSIDKVIDLCTSMANAMGGNLKS